MPIQSILPIEEIRERDIDLLLLEEIIVNERFREFFIIELGLKNIGFFAGAYHSLTQGGRGESDLVLHYKSPTKHGFLILIENKIDANFADRQAERYKERGLVYKKEKECSDFATVLIAPQSYITAKHGFDFSISYETIKNWFNYQKDARSAYKASVLGSAIERRRRGYQRIRSDEVTSFQHKFYKLSQSMFPELCFRKPVNDVPRGSGFMYCEPPLLKKNNIQIVHKFFSKKPFNAVDLQMVGRAGELQIFASNYENKLEAGMEIVRVSQSIAVRFTLDRLETTGSFEEQRDSLVLSINYAKKLYDWALRNIIS